MLLLPKATFLVAAVSVLLTTAQPTSGGNGASQCTVNGTTYPEGLSIPSSDPCQNCTCTANGSITCADRFCGPLPSCPLGTWVVVQDLRDCCLTYNCSDSCIINGSAYALGEKVPTKNFCEECTCAFGGLVMCKRPFCFVPACPSGEAVPINRDSECCPLYRCPTFCFVNGTVYTEGESVPSEDPCQDCTCTANGSITCTDVSGSCSMPSCPNGSRDVSNHMPSECVAVPPPPVGPFVPPLPPPVVVSFRFDPDRPDMVNVSWLPVSLDGHPDVSLDGYYIEVSRDRNNSDIVSSATAPASVTSFVFSIGEYSDKYWVRVKAVKGDVDVSEFSVWVQIDPLPPPVPPPVVVSFRFDLDHPDMVNVSWLPVSLDGHPDVSLDGYYIEVSRDRNNSDIVSSATAPASVTSFVLSIGEYSDKYWVRVKAVKGDIDVTEFSDWLAIEVSLPVVNGQVALEAWAIAVIALACVCLLLFCFILLCSLLLCFAKKTASKGEYQVEKKENATDEMELTYKL